MLPYETVVHTNYQIIRYGKACLSLVEKTAVTVQLLSARTPPEVLERFYTSVHFPGNRDSAGDCKAVW